jgi:hypothetical protein
VLPPVLGPITPHKRILGCAFILMAVIVAPCVHFALVLRYSARAADASILALLIAYVGVIYVPRLQRVTELTSYIALGVTVVLSVLFLAFAPQLKAAIAVGLGFYDDRLPWSDASVPQEVTEYRDPIGNFVLKIPMSWKAQPGAIPGMTEFVLPGPDATKPVARLRQTCDFEDVPLAVKVTELVPNHPNLKRSCGRWQGMDACLLEERDSTLTWDWVARDSAHGLNIRLTFEPLAEAQKADALAIIHSLRRTH